MRCMRVIKHCFISLFLFIVQTVTAQINYGTTGLMNLPTCLLYTSDAADD